MFSIQNYSVSIQDHVVIKNCNLILQSGSVHVLMGPNGSGKSSLVTSLMGHPAYTASGEIFLQGQNIFSFATHQKSLQGIFLAMQHPIEIEGLQVLYFLQELVRVHKKIMLSQDFLAHVHNLLNLVGLAPSILQRSVNVGFSGGEKKRFELLQMLLLEPKIIMLDEIDSGVDLDGLKMIANVLLEYKQKNPECILFFVSHYRKIIDYLKPDFVHVMIDGEIVQSGDAKLLDIIEQYGYESYAKRS